MPTHTTTRAASFEKYAYWGLLALIFVLPLAVHTAVAVPAVMTKLFAGGSLLLVSTIFYGIYIFRAQQLHVPKVFILCAVWGVPLSYLISTLFAAEPATGFFGERLSMDSVAFTAMLAGAVTLSALVFTTPARIRGFFLALLAGAGVLAVLELILFFARDAVGAMGVMLPSLSLLGTLNDLAVFFGLIALLIILALTLLPLSVRRQVVLWVSLLIALFFLAVVNLTSLWVLLAVFVLGVLVYSAYVVLARSAGGEGRGQISWSALLVVVVAAIHIFGSPALTSNLATQLQVGELDVRPNWSTTVEIGQEGLNEHLLLGAGPGSFVYLWAEHLPAEISATQFWQADFAYGVGFVPTAVVSTGLVGLLAWLGFFGSFLYAGMRAFLTRFRSRQRSGGVFIRASSFLGALFLWLVAIVQVPSPALLLYAALFTGLFIASLTLKGGRYNTLNFVFTNKPRAGFIMTLLVTLLMLVSVAGMYGLYRHYTAELGYQRALVVLTAGSDVERAETDLERAIARNAVDTYYRLLSNVSVVRIQTLLADAQTPEAIRDELRALLGTVVQHAQAAIEVDKRDYRNWVNLGSLYQNLVPFGLEGTAESARVAFTQALALRPHSPSIHLALALIAEAEGNTERAQASIQQALTLRPTYTEALFVQAQLQLAADNTEAAIESVEAITVLNPRNPVAYFQLGLLYYEDERYTEAVNAFSQSVALNELYANARYYLGLAYYQLGDIPAAIEQFVAVQETNPENEDVARILAALRAGEDPFATVEEPELPNALDDLPDNTDLEMMREAGLPR